MKNTWKMTAKRLHRIASRYLTGGMLSVENGYDINSQSTKYTVAFIKGGRGVMVSEKVSNRNVDEGERMMLKKMLSNVKGLAKLA